MPLTRLSIHHCRNIEACDINLSSGFNFFIGANGSGKTSLLEAIYFLGHGRSFRTNLISRVIQQGQPELFIHAKLSADNHHIPIGIHRQKDGNGDVKIAGQSNQKIAQLAQVLPLQLIHTEGFELLTEGPKFRRSFIDWGIFHSQIQFYQTWTRYKRLMKQRNALLKNVRDYQELSPWDNELAKCADILDQWRANYVLEFKPIAEKIAIEFLPEFEVKIEYYRGWDKSTSYQEVLSTNFERDQQLGYTFSGPNKADLKLKINGTPIEDVLSRGQLKLMVCALRLAQGQYLSQATGKQCIYLIDDFASELDSQRRKRLANYLKQTKAQVFISAITPDQIAEMQDENSQMFFLDDGKIALN